jgi:hypothetical protein
MIFIIGFLILFLILFLIIYYFITKKNNINIVISLTTSPKRIKYINQVIDNMFSQTIKPNKIVLNIPYIFNRTNEKYIIPNFLNHPNIIINRTYDLGPITKIIPTFNLNFPNNTIIISIDDDINYGNNMIETIVDHNIKFPNSVLTSSGFIENKMIAGFSGVSYPYKLFKNINIDLNIPEVCKFSDDFVISNYILNNKIEIKLIKGYTIKPLEYGLQEDALHKGGAIKPDKNVDDVHLINYKKCAKYYKEKNELNKNLEIWLNYKP